MAKRIIWSHRAQTDRKEILEYWKNRTKSTTYSRKLDLLFREALSIIQDYPQLGKPTDDLKARIKIIRDYFLIYEETEDSIILLSIWDNRQDPEKLEKKIQ
jgi:toxin YoeB